LATLTEMPPVEHNRKLDYHALNAMLNLYGPDGNIQFDKDREAAREYFLQHVNPNTVFFHSLREKMDYLVENKYYEPEILSSTTSPSSSPCRSRPTPRSSASRRSWAPSSTTPRTRSRPSTASGTSSASRTAW